MARETPGPKRARSVASRAMVAAKQRCNVNGRTLKFSLTLAIAITVFLYYTGKHTIHQNTQARFTESTEKHILHLPVTENTSLELMITNNIPDPFHEISLSPSVEENIDNMKLDNLPFHKDFRNPCWYERVLGPHISYSKSGLINQYKHRIYADNVGYRDLERILKSRAEDDQNKTSWRLRCLPYFYVAGFSKCGTSDLFLSINAHNDTAMPFWKEFAYWSWRRWGWKDPFQNFIDLKPKYRTSNPNDQLNAFWNQHKAPFKDYMDLFDVAAEKVRKEIQIVGGNVYHRKIIGEGTPSYAWSPTGWRGMVPNVYRSLGALQDEPRYVIAHTIHMLTPGAKIIFMLRDPVSRLYSEYFFFSEKLKKKVSKEDFTKRAVASMKTLNVCLRNSTMRTCLYTYENISDPVRLQVGIYVEYLRDWLSVFPSDQILILRYEDYASNKTEIVNRAHRFLGLDPVDPSAYATLPQFNERSNISRQIGDMPKNTNKLLQDFHRPWNRQLEELLYKHGYKWTPWDY